MRYLRSLKLLLVVAAVGVVLAFFERQRTAEYGHLLERTHARGQPQLKGTSLQELAQVLLELYPEGAEANLLMGTALADEGRLEEARAHLEKAMEVDRAQLAATLFVRAAFAGYGRGYGESASGSGRIESVFSALAGEGGAVLWRGFKGEDAVWWG